MLAEISAVFTLATNATKLLSGLRDIVKDGKPREEISKAQAVVADLVSKVENVQAKYTELVKDKEAIATELKQYKDWDTKASKYHLKEISVGRRVFALNENILPVQSPLYFCPNCFQNKKESVLQGIDVEAVHYECTAKCGFETPRTFPVPPPKVNFSFPGQRGNRGLGR